MDISALSFALGAPTESGSKPTEVSAGFDGLLEQFEASGYMPPGAPPGPEPPPDLLLAGEGVEITEPNAQSQKLDFLPLQNTELDIELPQPFWEQSADSKGSESGSNNPKGADEAMGWLVSQMAGGFFAEPMSTPVDFATDLVADDLSVPPTQDSEFTPASMPTHGFAVDTKTALGGRDRVNYSEEPTTLSNEAAENDFQNPTLQLSCKQPDPQVSVSKGEALPVDADVLESLNVTSIESQDADIVKNSESNNEVRKANTSSRSAHKGNQDPAESVRSVTSVEVDSSIQAESKAKTEPSNMVAARESSKRSPKGAALEDSQAPSTLSPVADEDKGSVKKLVQRDRSADGAFSDVSRRLPEKKVAIAKEAVLLEASRGLLEAATSQVASLSTPRSTDARPALTPTEVDLVVKQAADKLQMLATARPRNGVTIHLNPEDFGSITVVVKTVGKMVETQISASDSRVSEALDQHQARLVEAMDSRGFQLHTVTVSQQSGQSNQSQDSARSWQQSNQQSNQQQSNNSHGQRGQADQQFHQPRPQSRMSSRRNEGVDLAI